MNSVFKELFEKNSEMKKKKYDLIFVHELFDRKTFRKNNKY